MTSQYWENTHTCCDRIRWDSICTVNLEFYQCLFTIKLVCFITEQSHLRFAIPCTRQIISLTNLTPGSRTISSRIQTILTRALQFLNASPSATLQRQCYWLAPTTLACFAYCCWRTQYQTDSASKPTGNTVVWKYLTITSTFPRR